MVRRGLWAVVAGFLLLVVTEAGTASADPVLTDTIPMDSYVHWVAVSPDGNRLYVTHYYNSKLSVVNTASNTVAASIPVGSSPWAAAVSPDGQRVYVTNELDDTVSVISTGTNTVAATIPVGASPRGVAMSPSGTRAYVANTGEATVSVINTATNTVTDTIGVDNLYPQGVAVSPDGTRAYVTDNAGMTVINTVTNSVVASIDVGGGLGNVAVSPDGERVYVTNQNHDGAVSVINAATNTVVGSPIPVGSLPRGVAVSPDGTRAYVVNYGSRSVSMINTATNAVVGSPIAVGSYPWGVAVSPDGTRAYVTNEGSRTVSALALRPSPPTSVTAIAGDRQVTASWSAPSYTGGRSIVSYVATASPGGHFCATGFTSCTITGLTRGTTYTVTVTATNSIGTSAPSEPSSPVALAGSGGPPGPSILPTMPPAASIRQTLSTRLPKRINLSGVTVLLPKNAHTNAGQLVRTVVRGTPAGARFTVIRGPKGMTSLRTFGDRRLRLKVIQKAPAITGFGPFSRTTTYNGGRRR